MAAVNIYKERNAIFISDLLDLHKPRIEYFTILVDMVFTFEIGIRIIL